MTAVRVECSVCGIFIGTMESERFSELHGSVYCNSCCPKPCARCAALEAVVMAWRRDDDTYDRAAAAYDAAGPHTCEVRA